MEAARRDRTGGGRDVREEEKDEDQMGVERHMGRDARSLVEDDGDCMNNETRLTSMASISGAPRPLVLTGPG
jgi:hypothetical protein